MFFIRHGPVSYYSPLLTDILDLHTWWWHARPTPVVYFYLNVFCLGASDTKRHWSQEFICYCREPAVIMSLLQPCYPCTLVSMLPMVYSYNLQPISNQWHWRENWTLTRQTKAGPWQMARNCKSLFLWVTCSNGWGTKNNIHTLCIVVATAFKS